MNISQLALLTKAEPDRGAASNPTNPPGLSAILKNIFFGSIIWPK